MQNHTTFSCLYLKISLHVSRNHPELPGAPVTAKRDAKRDAKRASRVVQNASSVLAQLYSSPRISWTLLAPSQKPWRTPGATRNSGAPVFARSNEEMNYLGCLYILPSMSGTRLKIKQLLCSI